MEKPRGIELVNKVGISKAHASGILSGMKAPSCSLAIYIYRKTGWRHNRIEKLTDDEIALLEKIEPWSGATN